MTKQRSRSKSFWKMYRRRLTVLTGLLLLTSCLSFAQLQTPNVQASDSIDTVAIVVTPFGPYPSSVEHSANPFILFVINRSGVQEETFSLIKPSAAAGTPSVGNQSSAAGPGNQSPATSGGQSGADSTNQSSAPEGADQASSAEPANQPNAAEPASQSPSTSGDPSTGAAAGVPSSAATPSLLDLHSTTGLQRDHQLINPLPGNYQLRFKAHPGWAVAITIGK